MNAMKKIVLSMVVAAAALVGCQKSEELTVSTGDKIQLTASASLPTEGRAIISKDENGVYRSRWAENEYLYLVEDCEGGSGSFLSQSMVRENEGETASFSFEVPALEASSYTYIATTAPVAIATRALFIELADEQDQYYKGGSYDAAFDVLLSKAVVMDAQPATEGLRFSMQRLNGALKLSVKNLALATGEEVESITFACEQPIVGEVKVTFDDLAAGTYPIPFEVEAGKTAVKTSINNTTGNFEVFYSCLPATLKAGESYTVTVKTDNATYHKVAKLPADMVIEPNEITSVTVNMSGATTKTDVLKFNDAYEYVIACKAADGKIYLMNRAKTTKNPTAAEVSSLGLTIDATTGAISGEIPNQYRWKAKASATETAGVYKAEFYYTVGDVIYNLIATSNAQGLAINYELSGAQTNSYVKELTIHEKEDGYTIKNTTANASIYVLLTTTTQFRFSPDANAPVTDVVYFYRVNAAPQKELTVITESTDLMAGTYAILYKNATGDYYALPNDTTISGEVGSYTNTLPSAVPINEVEIAFNDDGTVASANVANRFKWVITQRGNTATYDLRSAVNMSHFLYMRDATKGVAIGAHEAVQVLGAFMPNWTFAYDADKKLHGYVHTYPRYLYVNANLAWGGATSAVLQNAGGSLVFVYLSGSTKQINE